MKDLPQPLQTWLIQSHLTPETDGHCLLFVDNRSLPLLNDIHYLSLIYPVIKSIHANMKSFHIVSFPVQKLIKDDILSFHSVKVL